MTLQQIYWSSEHIFFILEVTTSITGCRAKTTKAMKKKYSEKKYRQKSDFFVDWGEGSISQGMLRRPGGRRSLANQFSGSEWRPKDVKIELLLSLWSSRNCLYCGQFQWYSGTSMLYLAAFGDRLMQELNWVWPQVRHTL